MQSNDESVIRQYSDLVYRLAYARAGNRQDADEIYQEVFLRYLKKHPDLENDTHTKAWFIRVTVNCANSLWRSPWKRYRELAEDDLILETRETTDLSRALKKLPPNYREVIHLFYYEDLSTDEISRILNRKKSTVRTQLTRARQRLKEILKEYDYEF
ncbi:MAG TPA: RNA polymerase subunit sigma-24 [Lachnospiraceae bacterium]|nr:RNA polymerase subunit sigma-24 [Lachnospiraceae bacterium]